MRSVGFTTVLVAFLVAVGLFAARAASLMHAVDLERAEVERRVGWLSVLLSLEQEASREPIDARHYREQVQETLQVADELQGVLDAPSLIRLQALREAIASPSEIDRAEIVERSGAITRIIRGQTGALSARLAERWDAMRTLMFASVALLLVALALLAALARERARLEGLALDLESEIGRQLTERDRMDAMLRHNDRLASIGTLAAGVAHEINNPLTYVLSSLDAAIALGRGDPSALREILSLASEAKEGAARIASVVRDLGTFARPQDGPAGPVSLGRVAESALAITAMQIRGKARVFVDIPEDLGVLAVEGQLVQVFVNLLVNATQALATLPPEGKEHEIHISALPRGEHVEICVSDTGIGIPEDLLPRVFDPFFTTKGSGQGSGLGLFLCHRIIERSSGHIRIESRQGLTEVYISLPRATLTTPDRPPEPTADVHLLRVLIIDDEHLVARALARLLREHTLTVVASVPDALGHIEQGTFDLVFCDLTLPDVPGRVFVESIRDRRPELLPRLVLMTGGEVSEVDRPLFDELRLKPIRKPFDTKVIREIVARAPPLSS